MAKFAFDGSGKMRPPTPEEMAEADAKSAILAYSHGTTEDGKPYYAYIAVKPSLYAEFQRRSAAREIFPLGEYGTILASDYAKGPTPDVIRYMHEVYGFDENYEDNLMQEVKLQQTAFLNAEKERMDGIVNMLKKKEGDKK